MWIKLLDVLPTIIMVESFLACIPYFVIGKYGSGLYWLSAGMLNMSVIYLIKSHG